MPSKRQKKAGFLLPDPVTGYPLLDVCLKIPNAPEYRQAFLGHIYKLGLWAIWEKSYLPNDTRARDAAELWRETLNAYLDMGCNDMNCCCDDPPALLRYNAEGQLERSTDGGTTWTAAPQFDPRFTAPQFPPLAGADGNDKKCIAATGAALLMKEQVGNQLTDSMSRYTLGQLLQDWSETLLQSGGNVFTALATIAANQTFALGIVALRAALTDPVYDTLKCIFYCNIGDDATFTTAQWSQVKSDISDQIGGIAGAFLGHLVDLLGASGLTNLARSGAATTGDCSTCCPNCADNWHDAVGHIIEYGAGYIIVQAVLYAPTGFYYTTIDTGPDNTVCCNFLGSEVISGTITDSFTAWQACGSGTLSNGFPAIGTAMHLIYNQSSVPFTVKYLWG